MTSPAAVTAVVPTRDRLHVLAGTLASILSQREVELDVVVVDEGSTDGTSEFLADLSRRDPRVRVIRHDVARGLPAARNAGVAAAAAPWVAFCDDDDVWAPDKLATQLAALDATGRDWCACGALMVDENLEVNGHWRLEPDTDLVAALAHRNVVPAGGSSVLVRRATLVDTGGFDESLRSAEDWDMWRRLALRGPAAVVDRPLVAYRIWPGSMTTKVQVMRESHVEVLRRIGERDRPLPDVERFLARQLVQGGSRGAASRAFLDIARRERSPKDAVRAMAVLIAPGYMRRTGRRRSIARVPSDWVEETRSWLDAARTARLPIA